MFGPIRHWLLYSLRPPPGTPTREVRKAGLVMALAGLLVLIAGFAVVGVAQGRLNDMDLAIELTFPLLFLGFASLVVGGYRAVLGAEPDAPGASGARRVAVGVTVGCASLAVPVVLFLLIAFALRR